MDAAATVKYPDITLALSGEDGNIFFIMGRATKAMRKAGCSDAQITEFTNEMTSGDYDHALQTCMRYFETT